VLNHRFKFKILLIALTAVLSAPMLHILCGPTTVLLWRLQTVVLFIFSELMARTKWSSKRIAQALKGR